MEPYVIDYLMELLKLHIITLKTIVLYAYILGHQSVKLPTRTISQATGISLRTISIHLKALRVLKLIKAIGYKGGTNHYTAIVYNEVIAVPPPPLLLSRLNNILNLKSRFTISSSSESRNISNKSIPSPVASRTRSSSFKFKKIENSKSRGRISEKHGTAISTGKKQDNDFDLQREKGKLVTLKSLRSDHYWGQINEMFQRYFNLQDHEFIGLLNKDRLRKLKTMLCDNKFNVEDYCLWYQRYKWPDKGFAWGLFLYQDMVSEFLTDDSVKKAAKIKQELNDAAISEGAKKTMAWLNKMEAEGRFDDVDIDADD